MRRRERTAGGVISFRPSLLPVLMLAFLAFWPAGAAIAAAETAPESMPEAMPESMPVSVPIAAPKEQVIARLEQLIASERIHYDVPGISAALVHEGAVVWRGAFGVSHAWRETPLEPAHTFAAGALALPLISHLALQEVAEGRIGLNDPLAGTLAPPWLPANPSRELVTLRRLLNHTAGLGDRADAPDHVLTFIPGDRFAYSREGYLYLQRLIEAWEGAPIGAVASEKLFKPLGMSDTAFTSAEAEDDAALADGHVAVLMPVSAFLLPFCVFYGGFFVIFACVARLARGNWNVQPSDLVPSFAAGIIGAIGTVWALYGWYLVPTVLLWTVIQGVCFALVYLLIVSLMKWLGILERRKRPRDGQGVRPLVRVLSVLLAFSVTVPILGVTIAAPSPSYDEANAPLSLRTTAEDMALFLAEALDPGALPDELGERLLRPSVQADDDLYWTDGFGLRVYQGRTTIFATGTAPGFYGLVVADPETRSGIVILSNAVWGNRAAQAVAGELFAMPPGWRVP